MTRPTTHEAGFTLVEVMIALMKSTSRSISRGSPTTVKENSAQNRREKKKREKKEKKEKKNAKGNASEPEEDEDDSW